ncbi:hypothetical protein BECAL_02523 [Bellilinea caldifistulae]|uniref:Glycosyltransferase RgtA/B/C/D-like domain-containing protein n=1 Tax=Bellilinea caldifistulae TaxID=360411 RepID=A0A0P6XPG6_9CHLR|nr:hypothetical protein [Bellilinea caldifistulae]KPL78534.1 hypothetical protein AC812_00860 [Bellilinea caldifistulae]GAP11335.1 hypothetical protein BECAL_02523 [Bellilinea caldifistulae]
MKLRWFEVAFALLVIAVHLTVIFAPMDLLLERWFTTDDAFYYFQVARNISEGRGSTLDGIHPSNGYHPLWMLVLIPVFSLARLDLFVPLRLVVGLSVLISLTSGIILYRFLSKTVHPFLAMLAAVFWFFFPPLHRSITQLGMESALNGLCVGVLIFLTGRLLEKPIAQESWRDRLLLGMTALLVLFARLDNVFLVLTVGLVVVFREKRRFIFWLFYLTVGLIAIYLAFFSRIGFPRLLNDFQHTLYAMIGLGVPLKIILAYSMGLFDPMWRGLRKEFSRVCLVSLSSAAVVAILLLMLNVSGVIGSYPRMVGLLDILYSMLLFLPARRLAIGLVGKIEDQEISPLREFFQNFRKWVWRGVGYALPIVIGLSAYLLLNLVWFGTPTPVSGQVKHWWGTILDIVYGQPVNSIPALFGFFENIGQSPWWLLFLPASIISNALSGGMGGVVESAWLRASLVVGWLVLVLIGLIWKIKKSNFDPRILVITPVLSACLLQIMYYTGSYYVNLRPWYWVNESLVGVLLFAFSLDGWFPLFSFIKRKEKWLVAFAGLSMMVIFVWGSLRLLNSYVLQRNTAQSYYLLEVELLEKHTPAGSLIGMPGGGTTAYFIHDRTIINLDGLINSYDYFQHLKNGRGREFLDQLRLDYVFGNPGMIEDSAPYYSLFDGRLEPVTDILEFRLYRYRAP